jgi:hypothetical protein
VAPAGADHRLGGRASVSMPVGGAETLYVGVICSVRNAIGELVSLAHAYNPCYSGGRDQEIHGLRLALAKSL